MKAAPLLFTGLAVLVAFRAKFWNIGAEGQLMAGAIAACFIGQREFLPAFSLVPLMIVAAAIFGALWALLPALLKVKLKVDDVVTTLLLNFIMLYGVTALLEGPWRDPKSGYPNSPSIRPEAEFPFLPVHQRASRRAAGAVAAIVDLVDDDAHHARLLDPRGRAQSRRRELCRHEGRARHRRRRARSPARSPGSPAPARWAACASRSPPTSPPATAMPASSIATLAELNPLGAIPAALFFAIIFNGAGTMARATGVPIYLADVIQGVALVTHGGGAAVRGVSAEVVRSPSPLAGEGRGGG